MKEEENATGDGEDDGSWIDLAGMTNEEYEEFLKKETGK